MFHNPRSHAVSERERARARASASESERARERERRHTAHTHTHTHTHKGNPAIMRLCSGICDLSRPPCQAFSKVSADL